VKKITDCRHGSLIQNYCPFRLHILGTIIKAKFYVQKKYMTKKCSKHKLKAKKTLKKNCKKKNQN